MNVILPQYFISLSLKDGGVRATPQKGLAEDSSISLSLDEWNGWAIKPTRYEAMRVKVVNHKPILALR